MIAAAAGFLAGSVHVVSGPDHLSAVAPIAVERRRRGGAVGLRWGLGHAAGVGAVGLLALSLRGILPIDVVSSWSERLVGVVLIGIGLWGFRAALSGRVHVHEHSHGGPRHVHIHVHDPKVSHAAPEAHDHSHAAFAVGTLHGLAGGSHLLGVLPALAFPSTLEAVTYLGAFAVGTVTAMAAFSSAIGWLASRSAVASAKTYRGFLSLCSGAAIAVGAVWIVS